MTDSLSLQKDWIHEGHELAYLHTNGQFITSKNTEPTF